MYFDGWRLTPDDPDRLREQIGPLVGAARPGERRSGALLPRPRGHARADRIGLRPGRPQRAHGRRVLARLRDQKLDRWLDAPFANGLLADARALSVQPFN